MGGLLKLNPEREALRGWKSWDSEGENICIHRSKNLTEGKKLKDVRMELQDTVANIWHFCLKPHGATTYIQHTPFDATEIQFGLIQHTCL